jgi:hypothetical protein
MSDTPEETLALWIECVNKLEMERVVKLYDEGSTMLPTFSPHCLSESRQIKEYFQQLSTRQSMRVDLHTETLKIMELDENKYILTGIYSFHFVVDDADLTFPSRFTLIIDTSRDKPILHHHSSQIPRTLS